MHKHKDTLDKFPTYTLLAKEIGIGPKAVWRWTRKGIPANRWPSVVDAAKKYGISDVSIRGLYKDTQS